MKRIVSVTALFVIATAVFAVDAAAVSNKTTAPTKSVTLHLVEKDVAFNFVDNPPRQGFRAAPLIGDQFALTTELQTRSGKHAGFLLATCTVARGGIRASGVCYGTYGLKGGQLAGIGSINFFGNQSDQIAIVGGTGVYEGVTGSSLEVSRGEDSQFTDVTIHLLYP